MCLLFAAYVNHRHILCHISDIEINGAMQKQAIQRWMRKSEIVQQDAYYQCLKWMCICSSAIDNFHITNLYLTMPTPPPPDSEWSDIQEQE